MARAKAAAVARRNHVVLLVRHDGAVRVAAGLAAGAATGACACGLGVVALGAGAGSRTQDRALVAASARVAAEVRGQHVPL